MAQRHPRLFALALAPAGALAKEESKIQVLLLEPGACPSEGNGHPKGRGPIGAVRSFLQDPGGKAELQLRVRGLAAGAEHTLLALETETDPAPRELTRFTTGSNGQFVGSFDLHKVDTFDSPTDPRGKYLVVEETSGGGDVLAGWLYGAPADDCPMTKVKELTRLAPGAGVDPSASVDARYDMRPNGHGSLLVQMRGVPPGDYDIHVEGAAANPVETLTPNPGGSARASFQTKPSKGNGQGGSKGHNKRGALGFDPRRMRIEVVKQGEEDVYFSGRMLAQIEGLNLCPESTTPLTLVLPAGTGTAAVQVDPDCTTTLELNASGLEAGTYDLRVDGVDVADVIVAGDGAVAESLDPTPEEVGSSSTIELVLQLSPP